MIVFDDLKRDSFYPLALTRSVGDLRCGILKLRQRLQALLNDDDNRVWIDPDLMDIYRERHPDWAVNAPAGTGTLMVSSRTRPSTEVMDRIREIKPGEALVCGADILAFITTTPLSDLPQDANELAAKGYSVSELPDSLYQDLSDLIHANDSLLRADFDMFFHDQDSFFETEPGVTVLNPYQAWIGEDVTLKPGVVVDASDGPVVIDEGAVVMPNAVITGPVYIGKNSTIKVGAKIYPGTTIGPVCKIGGEVEGSIFQAYSNKQHDGFLGHSFVGEWVNIGADTNNSDLKNTYMEVEFYSYRARQKIPSGSIFLGTLIGDHTKLGINTTINTGTVIGCGCNLWGSALIAGFIPDLSWGTADALKPYRLPAFFATASVVKQRRKLVLSPAEIKLYQQIKELTDNV
jgi:UDP-N-acetylglucosamine diphosphorylase/glucosamine-1-phosphate N-acetyltransferase